MDWVAGRSIVPQVEVAVGVISAVMLTAASIEVNGVKALSNTERTVEVCNRERRIWCSLVEIFSSVIGWSDFVACEFDYWIGDDGDIVN